MSSMRSNLGLDRYFFQISFFPPNFFFKNSGIIYHNKMYRFQTYRLMSFDKYIPPFNYPPSGN